MQDAKAYILIAAVVIFLILLVQNTQIVTLRFLFWGVQVSELALVLIVGLVAFAGGYAARAIQVKRRSKRSQIP